MPASSNRHDLDHYVAETSSVNSGRQDHRGSGVLMAAEEEKLLRLDLSDVEIPKTRGLDVDGLHLSWFDRLFGRR